MQERAQTLSHRTGADAIREKLDADERDLKWLSRHTGWSYTHLWRVMNEGRAISPDLAERLATLFGVPASTFLPESEAE